MKRFISLLLIFVTFSICLFAEEDDYFDDDQYYDDVYVYSQNGAGDQFLKINLGAIFPLNFHGQLKPGGKATLGFYRFLTENIAVGGEISATYSVSIGEKILVMLPLTGGIMYQPYIGKFEFPIFAEIGVANTTWQNMEHFPSLVTRLSAGAYYRITDSISFGLSSEFLWNPQWFKDSSMNYNGLFQTAEIGLRYHF